MVRIGSWRYWIASLVLATALSACGGQKEPAQKAVTDAEAAISALRSDAAKLVPDDLSALDESLVGLKADFDRQDYRAVIAASPVVMARVGALQETISTRKAEQVAHSAQLTDSWNALSTEVPEMIDAVNARVESLVRTKKFPSGMNTTSFETTRAAATDMTQTWQKALGAFANDNMEEAVGSAQAAKQKGAEVMNTLGMKPNS
jgi:hypothetical protein